MPNKRNGAAMLAGTVSVLIFFGFLVYYMLISGVTATGETASENYYSNLPMDIIFVLFVFLVLPVALLKFMAAMSREFRHDRSHFKMKDFADPDRKPHQGSH